MHSLLHYAVWNFTALTQQSSMLVSFSHKIVWLQHSREWKVWHLFSLFQLARSECLGHDGDLGFLHNKGTNYSSEYLFWNIWVRSMFDSALQPDSWILYCQTGFQIWLYRSILFFMDRWDFHPFIQYILLNLKFNSYSFFMMCSFQRSLVSRFIPRYL